MQISLFVYLSVCAPNTEVNNNDDVNMKIKKKI